MEKRTRILLGGNKNCILLFCLVSGDCFGNNGPVTLEGNDGKQSRRQTFKILGYGSMKPVNIGGLRRSLLGWDRCVMVNGKKPDLANLGGRLWGPSENQGFQKNTKHKIKKMAGKVGVKRGSN